ncbi:MAG TPA: hypothetical protein VEF76_08145 [Patescibacteria group bacterium]|nr:hypothetical protein [Patescibacteria group bacterium]
MSAQQSDEIQKQADEIVRHIQGIVPPEMLGFLIAALMVIGFIGIVWFVKRLKSPIARAGGKVSAKRGRSRARDAALAAGFQVDDVERDIPEFGKGSIYVLSAGKCADYHWPENIRSRAQFSLLCRPGETSPGIDESGWVLVQKEGRISEDMRSVLASIARSLGEPREYLEIDIINSQIHFFWKERGGDEAVDTLTTFVEMIKRAA